MAGTDKSEMVFMSVAAQNQSQPCPECPPRLLGCRSLILLFWHHPGGCVHWAGVTGRLQCRDKSLNESEPLTAEHYLLFPGISIRRKYLEGSGVSEFAADFPVFYQPGSQPWFNTTLVDVRSTAHLPALLSGVLLFSFVEFKVRICFSLESFV